MADRQARLEEARQRALIITEHIRERADLGVRQTIQNFDAHLNFEGRLEDLAIAPEAWAHIVRAQIDPKLVFAHPDMLRAYPQTSLHYRGIAPGNAGVSPAIRVAAQRSPKTHPHCGIHPPIRVQPRFGVVQSSGLSITV